MRATVRRPDPAGAVELRIDGISPADEKIGAGKEPTPEELLSASLASCTATTMEIYARRKGWQVGEVEVHVDYTPAQRGSPTRCMVVVRLPEHLSPERRERLMQVGATSRIHRALEGEISFDERLELTAAAQAASSELAPHEPRRRIALLNRRRRARRQPQG